MGFLSKKISLEFSTSTIKIVHEGKLMLSEKTQIAYDDSGRVIATGDLVDKKVHKKIIYPLTGGVISDFIAFESLLRSLIKKGIDKKSRSFIAPSLTIGCIIPDFCTDVEIRCIRDSLEHAGAREAYMIYSSFALIDGIGLDKKDTFFLLDAGAGKVSFSIVSDNHIEKVSRLDFGANKIKQVIWHTIKRQHKITCSPATIDEILHDFVSCRIKPKINKSKIVGLDNNGESQYVEIDLINLNSVVAPYLELMINETMMLIGSYQSKSTTKINYLVMTGGLSKLSCLDKELERATGMSVINKSDSDYTLKGLLKLDSEFKTNKAAIR